MGQACLICFEELPGNAASYHPKCLKGLFSTGKAPAIAFSLAQLAEKAREMVGQLSLSGVQQKLSMRLSPDKKVLDVAGSGGRYILKPQVPTFAALPENEALVMQLARRAGIETPPSGLMRLSDDSLAYVCLRFDRLSTGKKLRLEDFCQLAELSPKEKYEGSYEQCARIVKRHATAPLVQLQRLFRLVLFSWWVGNEDLHRKNLSLLVRENGDVVLSPAYDILSSRLHLRDRELGLKLNGKDRRIQLQDWRTLARACDLNDVVLKKASMSLQLLAEPALQLVGNSKLPENQKRELAELIQTNTRLLLETP